MLSVALAGAVAFGLPVRLAPRVALALGVGVVLWVLRLRGLRAKRRNVLIGSGVSHFVEKARWAMDVSGIPYTERQYYTGLNAFIGGRSIPRLEAGPTVLGESADIVEYASLHATSDSPLLRMSPGYRKWQREFDDRLGTHVRRWLYFHLLRSNPRAVARLWAAGAPGWQRLLAKFGLFQVVRAMLVRALGITERAAQRSRDVVYEVLGSVEEALAQQGSEFLGGAQPDLSDLTFAALAAPLVQPPEYGGVMPTADEIPPELRSELAAIRERPAGKLALRMFARYRAPAAAAGRGGNGTGERR